MARKGKVGITVEAKDKATPTIKKVGVSIERMANKAAKEFKSFGKSMLGAFAPLNAGLEIAKKVFRALNQTIGASFRKALEFRHAWDPAKKALTDFGKAADTSLARMGDLLVPLIAGMARAWTEASSGIDQWIATNERALQTGIIDFVVSLSVKLGTVLAVSAKMATKSFSGLVMLWHEGAAALARIQMLISLKTMEGPELTQRLKDLEKFMEASEGAAAQAMSDQKRNESGIEKMHGLLTEGAELARKFGYEYTSGAQRATSATTDLVKAQDALNQKMDEAVKRLDEKAAKESEKWSSRKTELANEADEKLKRYGEDVQENRIALDKKKQDDDKMGEDLETKRSAETKKTTDEMEVKFKAAFDDIHGIASEAFSGIGTEIDGKTKTWGDAIGSLFAGLGKMALEMAANIVIGKGIEMAATAAAGQAGVAANAAVAGSGAVMAMTQGFASGGAVSGGVRGKDSVLIKAMHGEYVMPTWATDEVKRTGQVPQGVVDGIRGGTPPRKGASGPSRPAYASGGAIRGYSVGGTVAGLALLGPIGYFGWMANIKKQDQERKRDAQVLADQLYGARIVRKYAATSESQTRILRAGRAGDTFESKMALIEEATKVAEMKKEDLLEQYQFAEKERLIQKPEISGRPGNKALLRAQTAQTALYGMDEKADFRGMNSSGPDAAIPRAFSGYTVPSTGRGGEDSVMVRARPGERVLSPGETQRQARNERAPQVTAQAGGTTTINVNTFGGPADMQRTLRDSVTPYLNRNAKLGIKNL